MFDAPWIPSWSHPHGAQFSPEQKIQLALNKQTIRFTQSQEIVIFLPLEPWSYKKRPPPPKKKKNETQNNKNRIQIIDLLKLNLIWLYGLNLYLWCVCHMVTRSTTNYRFWFVHISHSKKIFLIFVVCSRFLSTHLSETDNVFEVGVWGLTVWMRGDPLYKNKKVGGRHCKVVDNSWYVSHFCFNINVGGCLPLTRHLVS